jgi:hypothetical protein
VSPLRCLNCLCSETQRSRAGLSSFAPPALDHAWNFEREYGRRCRPAASRLPQFIWGHLKVAATKFDERPAGDGGPYKSQEKPKSTARNRCAK